MKKTIALLLSLSLILLLFAGCDSEPENIYGEAVSYPQSEEFAETGKKDGFSYTVFEDHTEITSVELSDTDTSVSFPSELGGKPVTVLCSGMLSGNGALKSVVIPDSVEIIENYAFSGCSALETVTMSANLKKAGCGTFAETPWFKSLDGEFVTVGRGVLIKYNGKGGAIELPANVGYISDAFAGNSSITSMVIPETVKGICDSAFYQCGSLSEIEIPEGLSDIGAEVLKETTWSAVQDGEFITVGDGVLIEYRGTETDVAIPDGVKYIAGAFYDNEEMTSVTVPSSVNFVRNGSFFNCTALEKVTFEGADTVLDNALFRDCVSLTSVKLPQALKVIEDYLFYGCNKLSSIEIPQSVKYLGAMSFYYCISLSEVELPDGLLELGSGAFFGCTVLKKVNIPDTVTRMGAVCFSCCFELEQFEIPPKVTVLESGVFSYCLLFKEVKIPERITRIGEYAFEAVSDITVDIEGSATVLEANIFGDEPKNAKLICPAGSVAEKFAQKNGIEYTNR